VLRTRLLLRKAFWVAYVILLFFQVLTNGFLTSRGVFRYSEPDILGWRILGAPVEDVLFGFCLIVASMAWWVWWGRRDALARRARTRAQPPAGADARARRPAG
jgi:lycopene cyclase domain-containing protein